MTTSFSTAKFSKVWGAKLAFLKICPQIGHGSGPNEKIRSMHDSHLDVPQENFRK
ncbi:hypothetical protein PGT21_026043 [Puccinia graminis f. sp. tritici]|uniref:Uncharacterized protein n=1 Tax=Puccinia graminis f. sp. tritici TaxID=56615 RepID=A0A5B0PAC6_PUCGR|nr:hypothetical protein PGT21_026043 [Puccinia graminis f. sp. tritici]KAA1117047.1 hypothetical protein PGTUg99_034764 [Puccinia graminis f. sp. tritici]